MLARLLLLAVAAAPPLAAGSTFEAGQLFQRYDTSGKGVMTKRDFERLMMDLAKPGAGAPMPAPGPSLTAPGGFGAMSAAAGSIPAAARPAYDALPTAPFQHTAGKIPYRNTETYTHFDETSGVPVPAERVSYHVATGHTVVPIMDAYSKRHSRLCALLSRRLMPRREQLMNIMRRVRSRVEEVRAKRTAIERTTMQDVETMIERLRSAEALKLSTLGSQLSDVQAEIEAIDRITEQVEGARSAGGVGAGIADFGGGSGADTGPLSSLDIIQMFPELCSAIDKPSSRPVGNMVDVTAEDLPTEVAERLEVLRRADKYEEALALKDAMLWELMQEREGLLDKQEKNGETLKQFEDEMANWLALSDKMAEEIASLRSQLKDQADLRAENQQMRHEIAILRAKQSERDARPLRGGRGGPSRPPPSSQQSGNWIYPDQA
mmetsp:Transcript_709/g.1747  ORF Transcript_709/g.1747 Transcript_709/m.1747 type:complete len:435 (-) Transcript_709:1555-2859(-)